MISFGAKYISSAEVRKISHVDSYDGPTKVSCVELNPKNKKDVEATLLLSDLWESNDRYEECVGFNIQASSKKQLAGDIRYYAITEQEDNFENLDAAEIVALSQVNVHDAKNVEIEYLQAKPEQRMMFSNPYVIKRAGTAMLNSLKNIFKGFKITLFSNESALGFYKKNGFVEDEAIRHKFTYDA